ncbi:MAG: formylglycine-generating enzyme family protein, partial [Gammaproteobacteria bacterium]|nr:formylglycine-generating enzyme family protein [Gammaproteobacteria bacterium]
VVKLTSFAANSQLVDMCLEDAAETSIQPFMDIIDQEPGEDKDLWSRQAAALRVVKRLDEPALEAIKSKLENHPLTVVSLWAKGVSREEHKGKDVIQSERGGYELVAIPGGVFMMGSPDSEVGRSGSEGPQHKVTVPEFYMGRYPVTNRQYGIFMAENSDVTEPEYWADRRYNQPEQPVVGVTWDDAQRFAEWAGLRLPTEAEWEYTCRAGTVTRHYPGEEVESLERAGWYGGNSDNQLHPVGEKEPTSYALYDMHANVWAWCEAA